MPDGRAIDALNLVFALAYPPLLWLLGLLLPPLLRRSRRSAERHWRELQAEGLPAAATVTNKLSIGPRRGEPTWAVEVAYPLEPGNWARANVAVAKDVYEALAVGQQVGVRRHPTRLASALLEDHESLPPPVPSGTRGETLRVALAMPLAATIASLPIAWAGLAEHGWLTVPAPAWARWVAHHAGDLPILAVALVLSAPMIGAVPTLVARLRLARRGSSAVATILERRSDDWIAPTGPQLRFAAATARWEDAAGAVHEVEAPVREALPRLVVGQEHRIRYLVPKRGNGRVVWVPEGEPTASWWEITGLIGVAALTAGVVGQVVTSVVSGR
jgi:hypothetical protein